MARIECNCYRHLPKAKRKYLGFVAKCISCGDLWYCQYADFINGVIWKRIKESSIERLTNG